MVTALETAAPCRRSEPRPGQRPSAALLPVFLLVFGMTGAHAETAISGEIFLDTLIVADESGVQSVPDEGEANPNGGGIRLFLDSARTDAVKTSIACTIASDGAASLDRAYAKTRFPLPVDGATLRVTAGKAPLSWGKGFLFNAADPVFGAVPAVSSISSTEYRIAADWMGTVYLPLGGFSFAELVYLPPIDSRHNRTGGRLVLAPSWRFLQSVEASYLFEEGPSQTASVSADGSLWADWYAAASGARESGVSGSGDFLSGINWTVSAGLFRIFEPFQEITVSARAETLLYPAEGRQVWYPSVQAGYDEFTLNLQALFATGRTLGSIESGSGDVPAAATLPWVDSGSGLLACGISCSPVNEITLSVTAVRQLGKGDLFDPETTVGFSLVVSF